MKASLYFGLAAAVCAYAAPARKTNLDVGEQAYDIMLSKDADVDAVLAGIEKKTDDAVVKHTFKNSYFRGFSGTFTKAEVGRLLTIPGVEDVEPAATMKINAVRKQSPWGLQRVTAKGAGAPAGNPEKLAFQYNFAQGSLGQGVDVYMIDTGIRTSHDEFAGGRAKMVFTTTGVNTDDNGHGTHTSGTAGGNTVGVASKANILGVKVLDADGSGSSSDFIKGLDFVLNRHEKRQQEGDFVASVASMSLGFTVKQKAVDKALVKMSEAGIHAAVASGNEGTDTCLASPGDLGGQNSNVVSVGAAAINDTVATFSNSGPCTDVYAPGVAVISSFMNSDDTYASLDGTSMATPHVAGLMAVILSDNKGLTPPQLKSKIVNDAFKGALDPSVTTIQGGNLIMANNFQLLEGQDAGNDPQPNKEVPKEPTKGVKDGGKEGAKGGDKKGAEVAPEKGAKGGMGEMEAPKKVGGGAAPAKGNATAPIKNNGTKAAGSMVRYFRRDNNLGKAVFL